MLLILTLSTLILCASNSDSEQAVSSIDYGYIKRTIFGACGLDLAYVALVLHTHTHVEGAEVIQLHITNLRSVLSVLTWSR